MKPKTSNIWAHFTVVENTTYAMCNICKRKYSLKTSVTNLKSHIKTNHWIQINSSKEVFHIIFLNYKSIQFYLE